MSEKKSYRVHVRDWQGKHDIHFVDATSKEDAREIVMADPQVDRVTRIEE